MYTFSYESCHSTKSYDVLAAACLNKNSCKIDVEDSVFGDPC